MEEIGRTVLMALYSLALTLVLVIGSPYWLLRMLTSGRYRAGLAGRLGMVPDALRNAASGAQVIWLHAVSVGEVLAATRLVRELEATLNAPETELSGNWIIVVSTTTATGQALARERFKAAGTEVRDENAPSRVFWYPLDFGWAVRAHLRELRPKMLVLMESEIWPRMLVECRRAGTPVAVVNARVSDRSFARGVKIRGLWRRVLGQISLFAAQSAEDARRLVVMGARAESVSVTGNLKYDVQPPRASRVAEQIARIAAWRPVIVAGSTVAGERGVPSEDELVIQAWKRDISAQQPSLLVIAPRHPQRFEDVAELLSGVRFLRASQIGAPRSEPTEAVLLDTIGDLASVYSVATMAFIGGSLVPRGGHNPLEAARFSVPVITGPSTTNFREVYAKLAETDGLVTVSSEKELGSAFAALLKDPAQAQALGERGRSVYEREQGATHRTVEALLELVRNGSVECR